MSRHQNPTRRTILAGAAAVPVAALPVVATADDPTAAAAGEGRDAELIRLGHLCDQLIEQWTTASEHFCAIDEKWSELEPDEPVALRCTSRLDQDAPDDPPSRGFYPQI